MDQRLGLLTTISFIVGGAIASGVTYILAKKKLTTKFETQENESIEEIRKYYSKKFEQLNADAAKAARANLMKPSEPVAPQNENYIQEEEVEKPKIHCITQDELGELYGYDVITLLYLKDNVLIDERDGFKIKNSEEMLGGSLKEFRNPDSNYISGDCLCVRNEDREIDYEILSDNQTYEEWKADHPYALEVD